MYSLASIYHLLALINKFKYKQRATFLSRKKEKKGKRLLVNVGLGKAWQSRQYL